jgi:putative ABC transport system permease protein
MFMQIGFRNALIDNNVQLFSLFDKQVAQLTMISQARYNMSTEQRFPSLLLERAKSMPGVTRACTVSLERGTANAKVEGFKTRSIRVIGIDLDHPEFFAEPSLYEKLNRADRENGALVDVRSKAFYGFANTVADLRRQRIELNDQRLPVVGQFELGTDFGNDGTLLMSERLHTRYFPWRSATGNPRDVIDIALIQTTAETPEELEEIRRRLQAIAPEEIQVKATDAFVMEEVKFWSEETPVGNIFLIGTIMGLVVGAIICYQIQFTDITDHMPEFATLKAMGYSPLYFASVILCQSFYLAFLGFIPGIAVSFVLYWILSESSGLLMMMTFPRILLVWCLTLVMCIVSGALAIRKLFNADPASLF